MSPRGLHLFEKIGVELEYMIVDRETLDVLPVTDRILELEAGELTTEVEVGELAWSNELVLHVIELKTNGPAVSLEGMGERFHRHLRKIQSHLDSFGARLMPTAMHPWMNPWKETQLWPHEHNVIFEAYDRIFDCKGHGWSNLQSNHINLPFDGDLEFGRLHAALRLILPVLPALAAASPIIEGRRGRFLDSRLDFYRHNQEKLPSLAGDIVPEPITTIEQYLKLLDGLYGDIRPFDPDGVLQEEWLNSRGVIPRFDRNALEVRVIDIQECPAADIAITETVVRLAKKLVESTWTGTSEQVSVPQPTLVHLFNDATLLAEGALIQSDQFLRQFGIQAKKMSMAEFWSEMTGVLYNTGEAKDQEFLGPLRVILTEGCLATRILRGLDTADGSLKGTLFGIYSTLCDCLDENRMFAAEKP